MRTIVKPNHMQREEKRETDSRFKLGAHAVAQPSDTVTSEELDHISGLQPGTSYELTGVQTRHVARHESITQLGARAVRAALQTSSVAFSDLDALISCGAICEQHIPCGAVLMQRELGESGSGVACFDIDATCLGFIRALELAVHLVNSPAYRRVMVVSSERPSIALNPKDPKTHALFGDGAAAYLFEQADEGESSFVMHDTDFASYGEYSEACRLVGGGARLSGLEYCEENHADFLFRMEGPTLFKACLKTFPRFVRQFLEKNNREMDTFRWVIPHQASRAALKQMQRHLRIPRTSMVDILETHGNQVSASIPTALSIALSSGPLLDGDEILLLGTGAGLGLGILLLEWRVA